MKKNILSGMVAFFSVITLGVVPLLAEEEVLFADNFNRADKVSVGATSTGDYQWAETETNPFSLWLSANQLVLNGGGGEGSGPKSGNIYVDYDLDAISSYKIDFVITSGVGQFSASGYTAIQPRGTGVFYASSWLLRANPDTKQVSLLFYDGSKETLVRNNAFATNSRTKISITVVNNTATLTVGGTDISDTRTLSSKANDGMPDYFGFSNSNYARSSVDDLVVIALPES
ncbi:hypothetical protein OPIT5_00505 [Opitutaceae bacterium TAV5]|nr:hypothetical protein OPIT5_00505 [Opitutaceae bacterium TAV5]